MMQITPRLSNVVVSDDTRAMSRNTCDGKVSCDRCGERRNDITLSRKHWLCGRCITSLQRHPALRAS